MKTTDHWRRPATLILALAAAAGVRGAASAATLGEVLVPTVVAAHQVPDAGRVDPARHLRLQVVLPMRDLPGLRHLLDDEIDNPASVGYRHYLSVADFTARFGPTSDDYRKAAAWFTAAGLAVTHVYPNRYMFQVEGAASDVERVLGIELHLYRHPTEDRLFMAPDREPAIALDVPLLSIIGLDDMTRPVPRFARPAGRPRTATGSGPDGNFLGSDLRAAYYGTGAAATLTGKGQSVGLMELAPYDPADINLYFKTFKQPLNVPVKGVSVDGTAPHCQSCDDGEQTLDVDYAISMAPGLDQLQVYVAGDPVAIEERMATDDTSKSLSTSWGYSENFKVEDPIYQEMAAQGQSWFTASGDDVTLQASGPWPEEDANIIAVGGSDLTTKAAGGAWASEAGWVDSASGPSLDTSIKITAYQKPFITKSNKGSTTLRNVSDVSANADFDMIICADGTCQTGWGGTSFASPVWAGFAALANELAAKRGRPAIGFINPTAYGAYKAHPGMTHDVVGNASGNYPAVRGYDLVGGLGSPRGLRTLNILVGQ